MPWCAIWRSSAKPFAGLPGEFKERHTEVPWSQIAGLRNRIVHDYFGLDLEIIWRVLETSLPEFKQHLANLRR